ncbi:MAG: hypothetical protein IT435_10695 [Phycisphaerales bacterium]|nr:hypothetical protein [Phycisphaerales bacterium]
MRSQPNVVVSLGPARLDVGRVHRGRIVARASAWLDRATIEQAWSTDISSLDPTLNQLLRSIDIPAGARAIIEYSGPDTSVDVFTLNESDDVMLAARKMLGDASDLDPASNPSFELFLGQCQEAGITQSHVLCTIDRDERSHALREWAVRAGLNPIAYVPIDAAAIQTAVRRALEADASTPTVVVHLGEQRTVIVLVHSGQLRMVRCVNIGATALVDATADATAAGAHNVDATQRKAAFELLRSNGIHPQSARASREDPADWLLPYINPALQRYIVEIRQTLRFGLGPQDAARAVLACSGAGAVLPGLADTLAAQLEVALADSPDPVIDSQSPHTADLGLSLQVDPLSLSLTPRAHRLAQASRRAVWGMAAGALTALAVVAGDAVYVWSQLSLQRGGISSQSPRLDELTRRLDSWKQAAELRRQNTEMYRAIRQGLGEQPDWKLVFSELSRASQDDMKLTDVSAEAGPAGITLSLRGLVASDSASHTAGSTPSASTAVSRFLSTLAGASVIESADLGETRAAEVRGVPVEVFAADVRLRGLPFYLSNTGGQ